MSEYPKEEILGHYGETRYGPDNKELVCLDCVRKQADGGLPILDSRNLLLKIDMDEDKMYFCDYCQMEIRPIDETPNNDKVEVEAKS